MNPDLDLCLHHLKALVGFDTSNPPRKTEESGLIEYLNSLDFIDPQIQDHGDGSFNIFFTKGSPKYLVNAHLDTVPAGDGWESNSPAPELPSSSGPGTLIPREWQGSEQRAPHRHLDAL